MAVGFSHRDDPNSFAALRVNDRDDQAIDHANRKKAIFAIVLAKILFDQRERVLENAERLLEADFVTAQVDCRLALIPFEIVVTHKSNGCQYSSQGWLLYGYSRTSTENACNALQSQFTARCPSGCRSRRRRLPVWACRRWPVAAVLPRRIAAAGRTWIAPRQRALQGPA